MRYRPNQDFVANTPILEIVEKVDPDTHRVVTQNFFPSEEKLPPAENFDTMTMIKAGVPLQKTNTKVLGSRVQEYAEILNAETTQTPNNEVNNEQ